MIWAMSDTESIEFITISFICGLPLFWLLVCGFPDWMKIRKTKVTDGISKENQA